MTAYKAELTIQIMPNGNHDDVLFHSTYHYEKYMLDDQALLKELIVVIGEMLDKS